MIFLGIDEAGRGAEVGPLVLAAVALSPDGASELLRQGLRDSKRLSAAGRVEVARLVKRVATWWSAETAPAPMVDAFVADRRRTLNGLERVLARRLLRRAPAFDRAVADGFRLFRSLATRPGVHAVDHADELFVEVTAAGLLAKVERDRLLGDLEREIASLIGHIPRRGYPGQETTDWIRRYREFFGGDPPHVRRSWYRGRAGDGREGIQVAVTARARG